MTEFINTIVIQMSKKNICETLLIAADKQVRYQRDSSKIAIIMLPRFDYHIISVRKTMNVHCCKNQ